MKADIIAICQTGRFLNNIRAIEAPEIIIISQFKPIRGGTLRNFTPNEVPYVYEPNKYVVFTPITSII